MRESASCGILNYYYYYYTLFTCCFAWKYFLKYGRDFLQVQKKITLVLYSRIIDREVNPAAGPLFFPPFLKVCILEAVLGII